MYTFTNSRLFDLPYKRQGRRRSCFTLDSLVCIYAYTTMYTFTKILRGQTHEHSPSRLCELPYKWQGRRRSCLTLDSLEYLQDLHYKHLSNNRLVIVIVYAKLETMAHRTVRIIKNCN